MEKIRKIDESVYLLIVFVKSNYGLKVGKIFGVKAVWRNILMIKFWQSFSKYV